MIEAFAEVDDAADGRSSSTATPTSRRARSARALRKGTHRDQARPGALRLGVQEQGRAAAARRGRRLPAVAARHPAGRRASTRTPARTRSRKADDNEPFAALAFKIMNDPFVGQLTFFRVYSGTLETRRRRSTTRRKGKRERIGRLLRMHANKREEINEVDAGNIAAAVGLRDTRTGDTLCDEKHADRPRADGRSPSRSSRSRSSRRPRPTRTSSGIALAEARRSRTRRSASTPTTRPARPSSPAWASSTSRSSSTA